MCSSSRWWHTLAFYVPMMFYLCVRHCVPLSWDDIVSTGGLISIDDECRL